jgi:HPt (histidine-containing phosphotransfer) domain-containing protein
MEDAKRKTESLLAAIWVRQRPLIKERLLTLDRAAAAAAAGTLELGLQEEAAGNAHKLAGSLGLYGYDEGTRIARELEVLLGSTNPDAARVTVLTVELRAVIFPGE